MTRAFEPLDLLTRVRDVGTSLVKAAPSELSLGNVVKRVLFIIRDESGTVTKDGEPAPTLAAAAATESDTPPMLTMISSKQPSLFHLLQPLASQAGSDTLCEVSIRHTLSHLGVCVG